MKSTLELRNEITQWANANFSAANPALGILEEIGEAAHIQLKSLQGIRGYDNPEKVKVDMKDAIADISIYALHYCGINDIEPPDDDSLPVVNIIPDDQIFSKLARSAGNILSEDRALAGNNIVRLFETLDILAVRHDLDLVTVINEVWEETVSKRDWKKNPDGAHGDSYSEEDASGESEEDGSTSNQKSSDTGSTENTEKSKEPSSDLVDTDTDGDEE